jgi:hypothetical protein
MQHDFEISLIDAVALVALFAIIAMFFATLLVHESFRDGVGGIHTVAASGITLVFVTLVMLQKIHKAWTVWRGDF